MRILDWLIGQISQSNRLPNVDRQLIQNKTVQKKQAEKQFCLPSLNSV